VLKEKWFPGHLLEVTKAKTERTTTNSRERTTNNRRKRPALRTAASETPAHLGQRRNQRDDDNMRKQRKTNVFQKSIFKLKYLLV